MNTGRISLLGVLAVFSLLLGVGSWGDWYGQTFNNPDGGNGDGYNPIVAPGEYQAPASIPALFPPNAHVALAEQAATDGQMEAARQHALNALRSNPANGEAALMLFDLHARPDYYKLETSEPEPADTNNVVDDEVDANTVPDTTQADEPAPTSAEAFLPLAPAQQTMTDRLADISHTLRPTHIATLNTLAEYWSAQDKSIKATPLWAMLLTKYGSAGEQAFPMFFAALENPDTRKLIQPYLETPPQWWPDFFRYLLEHETDNSKIQQIYQARLRSAQPPDARERDSYIQHLFKQQRWAEAYQIWSDGITPKSDIASLLYDGGFEDTAPENRQFGWQLGKPKEAAIKQTSTTGANGRHALQISFKKGKSLIFQHITQTRLLATGTYTLSGRYRVIQLKTAKGLRWRVRCMTDNKAASDPAGESEAFKGNNGWQEFQFNFTVPEGCHRQIVRLESDSPYAHHNVFEGSLWFDDLAIKPANQSNLSREQ